MHAPVDALDAIEAVALAGRDQWAEVFTPSPAERHHSHSATTVKPTPRPFGISAPAA